MSILNEELNGSMPKTKAKSPTRMGPTLLGCPDARSTLGSLAEALLSLSRLSTSVRARQGAHFEIISLGDSPRNTTESTAELQPNDRRRFPRRDSRSHVSVRCPDQLEIVSPQQIEWLLHSSQLKGQIVDIGMQGVAFRLPEPLEVGRTITLRLSNDRLDECVDALAHVIRATRDDNDGWKIVCCFVQKLTFEQVHHLGQHLVAPGAI